MFYSQSTRGFYDSEVHDVMPEDVVEITKEQWQALLEGQNQGKNIVPDENGYPVLADPVDTRTYAQKRAMEYPPIADYLDGVVKGNQTQIDKYIADCLAVKAKYPKE
jgi:hypothetical protein